MQEKIIFREMLSEIKELADEKQGRLTVEEIKEFFKNAHLDENQMELIYQYLAGQKIRVDGYTASEAADAEEEHEKAQGEQGQETDQVPEADSRLEDDYVRMYLEDIKGVKPAGEDEEEQLYGKAAGGDDLAKGRLIELNLKTVYDISKEYRRGALPQSDLIQEGNIALMLALDGLDSMGSLGEYREYVRRAVSDAMESALEEQENARDMDEEIAQRVNFLSEAIENLTLDLEHKVSIEELSAYLEMPIEEIKDILRMAGDEIEIEGGGHDHHDEQYHDEQYQGEHHHEHHHHHEGACHGHTHDYHENGNEHGCGCRHDHDTDN